MASTVTILGCGSVGAPVAVALAQSGVGRLNLVDHDELSWANVGRHPLGAASVRSNKAEAMASKLRADYPHGRFEAFPVSAQAMLAAHEACLNESNIIVSCMGDWRGESRLNDWHCRQGRSKPVVYGWTEAHAAAGHAVAISREGGCLRCGLGRTGAPNFQVVAWPDSMGASLEEPACGAHYQPYGPVELGFTTSLIAQYALKCLLGKIIRSGQRIYAARRAFLDELGARWSDGWFTEYPAHIEGGIVVDRPWPINFCCTCSGPVTELDPANAPGAQPGRPGPSTSGTW